MVDIKTLLPELKKLVTDLSVDMLKRVGDNAEINDGLKNAYGQIEKGGRTAQAYEVWLEDYLDQVAVAWVLSCVFVRFMEDNGLIDECWLAGEGEHRKRAEDAHTIYFREHPHDSDREYFEHVFHEVGKIPAATDLFAEGKTPLWAVGPTGDAARNLLKFWQEIDTDEGHLKRSFEVENGDTRFLGDLYQELSERAKKKYALLQTPVFVEEFILDRTLTPALDEFGLETVRMIDPTCGSGHFLLGAFSRLFDEWIKRENNEIKAAQKALDGVWGVDINPFAVAIARFRLIVAAVQVCDIKRLKKAPGWEVHLAAGDSLLFGSRPTFGGERVGVAQQKSLFEVPAIYAVEDRKSLQHILGQGYHVVVGNPPYIIVRDRAQNSAYRNLYSTCHQKYSLGVPFTQRFWELAVQLGESNGGCGYIGMITTNSFMKREFGKKLIEEFFPKNDLTHVIDTSGAYIPGHGTPTVILLGRNRKPVGDLVRAVLGIKGEPATPADPSQGLVWKSILSNIDKAGGEDAFMSSSDVPRTTFKIHPWSIGGGGVSDLMTTITKRCERILGDCCTSVGYASFPGLDDPFVLTTDSLMRKHVLTDVIRDYIDGEAIRDWGVSCTSAALAPYDSKFALLPFDERESWCRHLWCFRTSLGNVMSFGQKTRADLGDSWWAWYRWIPNKYKMPLSITYAKVATHNHCAVDRGGRVFNGHAFVVKLRPEFGEDECVGLAGVMSSSTACFWMKQTFHNKGSSVDQHGARQRTAPFEDFYEFAGTQMKNLPLPDCWPNALSSQLDRLAQQRSERSPQSCVQLGTPNQDSLKAASKETDEINGKMVVLQEELDWHCYQLYGFLSDDFCYEGDDLPEIVLGERAFEIVMARNLANGELETTWFERHGSTPITDIPTHWPKAYRKLVERRIDVIETNKAIRLIEKPEFKRRWNSESWEDQERHALRSWLLDRLEGKGYWPDAKTHEPTLQTAAQLTDKASHDDEFNQVAALYRGRSDFDLSALVAELVETEVVPFLPVLRYKPSGLRKRIIWERTWELQRQEDGGEDVGDIPVPPKYTASDFQTTDYWKMRGRLDVPKERWISYPHCEREGDPSLVVGWAGWNYLQQATALVAYYDARKREGWTAERLKLILAGVDQLLPWIHQWHPEIDPEYNETAGASFQTLLESEAQELGLTLEEIRNWTPPKKTTRRKRKAT